MGGARILVPVNADSHTSIELTSLVIGCLILIGVGAALFCSRCRKMLERRRTTLATSPAEPVVNGSTSPATVYSKEGSGPTPWNWCLQTGMKLMLNLSEHKSSLRDGAGIAGLQASISCRFHLDIASFKLDISPMPAVIRKTEDDKISIGSSDPEPAWLIIADIADSWAFKPECLLVDTDSIDSFHNEFN